MSNSPKILKAGILITALVIPVFAFLFMVTFGENHYKVPIYYPQSINEETGDTIYHTIPDFSFVSQTGEAVTHQDFEGKLYIANYFFTTCLGPCPKMSSQMELLQKQLKNEDRVLLISHTVDPKHDSVPVLRDYGDVYNVNPEKWKLVTGEKKALYWLAREAGYKLAVGQGDGGESDFVHSQKLVLVDEQRRIRGYYDGIDIEEIKRLLDEISIILREKELSENEE